jgi:hypothetical protein
MLKAWSPAGGAVLGDGVQLEEVSWWGYAFEGYIRTLACTSSSLFSSCHEVSNSTLSNALQP